MIKISFSCVCNKVFDVLVSHKEDAVFAARTFGWVGSTDDLRRFEMEGVIPILSCCASCWQAREWMNAVRRIEATPVNDTMVHAHPFWSAFELPSASPFVDD